MSLLAASLGARARQGGAALARPFDGSNLDLTTGPVAGTALSAPPVAAAGSYYLGTSQSAQASYLGAGVANLNIGYTPGGSQPYEIGVYSPGGAMKNSRCSLPVYSHDTSSPLALVHCAIAADQNALAKSVVSSAAIQGWGLIKGCNTSNTCEDGVWPGMYNAGWTVVEDHDEIADPYPAYGGFPYGGTYPYTSAYAPGQPNSNTGVFLTSSQVAGATSYAASLAVTNGEFIVAPSNGSVQVPMYQVVTAGTLGTENPNTWPVGPSAVWSNLAAGETTQPFTSGTAELIYVGGAVHCDGFQSTSQQRVVLRRVRVMDFSNSCGLIQNFNGNTNPTPVMNWVIEDYVARGGGNYDWYVQSQNGDTTYTYTGPSHNVQGGFTRVSATDWTVSATPGQSRPWHVSFRRGKHLQATSPHSPRGLNQPPVTFNQALITYGALIVRSEQIRDQLIASQYGWDIGDQRIGMMRAGTYDYTTMPPPDSSVLEARLQALISTVGNTALIAATPGACDARTMVVWEPSIVNEAGTAITPSTNAGLSYPVNTAVTDAQGYYIGS